MSKRLNNLSYLRAVACVAIVLLHISASEYILYADSLSMSRRFLAMSLYVLSYWAVPCFLMVSGVLLLDPAKDIPLKKIISVYLRRMLLALLIFGLVFRVFDMVMDGEALSVAGFLQGFVEIYAGTGWSHLWYLYLLIGIYILLPMFRAFTRTSSDQELLFFLGAILLINSILPITDIFGVSTGFYLPIGIIYPLYFFVGYALHRGVIKINTWAALVLIFAGIAGVLCFCYVYCYGIMADVSNLLGYSSIFIVFLSTGIFTLFDRMKDKTVGIVGRALLGLDECSFGIYLIHMMIVRYVLRYRGVDLFEGSIVISILRLVLMTAGTVAVSYLAVWLLKLIPAVKKARII